MRLHEFYNKIMRKGEDSKHITFQKYNIRVGSKLGKQYFNFNISNLTLSLCPVKLVLYALEE